MPENFSAINLLYDFYGDLLAERPRELFRLYYEENYSLAEIAEISGLTRQGVHESVRRATMRLQAYERALGLAARFEMNDRRLNEAIAALDRLIAKPEGALSDKAELRQIRRTLTALIETN
ncbi:MAG TPA: DNA-binding protein [Clostridiales bacterium]|jgi:predicted DNA-binding protein YlxM (UPF0122 family)|nr:DNA-binding protein [Clostridiales bacterium]